jgi:transposase
MAMAELSRRDLVPEVLAAHPRGAGRAGAGTIPVAPGPPPTALKHRIHATLLAFGKPCPVSDLFGAGGRALLAALASTCSSPPRGN